MNDLCDSFTSTSAKNIEFWYDDFAEKLLSENFLLTALEFYAELTESGKELPKLRDFFSNPGNFEQQSISKSETAQSVNLPRSSSQATLDSLDLTRYSEDGERGIDDKVAVLEFELRKARETISALRATLTEATESESNKFRMLEKNFNEKEPNSKMQLSIKPHEQRALNFLINEYLLLNGYKLTSITFADENESQDFEDWNDVGLNCARPLELLHLYREVCRSGGFFSSKETNDFECQVTLYDEIQQTLHINELESQIAELTSEINLMKAEFSKKFNSSEKEETPGDSERSLTPDPDNFEIIESLKNNEEMETKSDKSLGDWTNIRVKNKKTKSEGTNDNQSFDSITRNDSIENQSVSETDESKDLLRDISRTEEICDVKENESALEINNFNEMINTNDQVVCTSNEEISCTDILGAICVSREMPVRFKNAIYQNCDITIPTSSNNDLFTNWFHETHLDDLTTDHLIKILSDSLPKIIPSIILNKREEIIPLLVLSICLNKDLTVRDKLLSLLFNLKKKPDTDESRTILEALLVIAKSKGSSMVENEILPQCWEQLSHKYVERRMLVAKSCFLLAPYVSETIRNSLIISIAQQLMLDREETVRKASVNILTILVTLITDDNKYSQILEICLQLLGDESADVLNSLGHLLFPTLAQWSFSLNKIQSDLFNKLLQKVKNDKNLFVIDIIKILLPYLVMSVAKSEFLSKLSSDSYPPPAKRQEFCHLCKGLCDPGLFFSGPVSKVISVLDFYTSNQDFESSGWLELEWIIQIFIPDLLEIGDNSLEDVKVLKGLISVLKFLCLGLGRNITNYKIKPFLLEKLLECENAIVSGQESKTSIISLYLAGVLSTFPEELQEMSNTLRRFICALPLCRVSLVPLQVTAEILCQYHSWQVLVLDAIWEGVVHQRPLVRSCAAVLLNSVVPFIPDGLLSTKIMPALVTLTSDPETSVRTNAVPALGRLLMAAKEKAVKDKVYMTLQTLLQDSISLENHGLMIQLVKTITFIYEYCEPKFGDEVVVPQLSAMTALASRTKSKDLVEALVEAFSVITSSQTQVSPHCIINAVLPGLRNLENICNQLVLPYHEHVDSMIKEIERRFSGLKENTKASTSTSPSSEVRRIPSVVSPQVVGDVRNRVTKIFNSRPNSLQNVSGIFKKKT